MRIIADLEPPDKALQLIGHCFDLPDVTNSLRSASLTWSGPAAELGCSVKTMARIWKEKRIGHWSLHFDLHAFHGLPGHDVSPNEKLLPVYNYFVDVCGFTFKFGSVAQIQPVLEFYSKDHLPSSRLPDSPWLRSEHDVAQRWFERLPGYLREKTKRKQVVKALTEALRVFASDLGRFPTEISCPKNLP